ncbi:MAG: hypothetical protein IJK52_07665 [Oscillospiraceae bacterium]|nr:hypothetical protein [Oscillospiraceae bacterium]
MYNFIDSCLNRSAAPDDAESYVEYWHTHDLNCSLREYMGMSVSEYELWLKRGDSAITDILRRRRELNAGRVRGLARKEA